MPAESHSLRPAAFHILLALSPGPLHGLGIAKAVDDVTRGTVTLGPGTLYRSLKELAAGRLIREVPATTGTDPRRRSYAITASGQTAVRAEAERLAHLVDIARLNRVLPGAP